MIVDSAGSSRSRWPLGAALLLLLASLALFWPGIVTYDGVRQYGQAVSGVYDDWHPPAMARLWAVVGAFGPGAGPMLLIQLGSYWLGLGLLGGALARIGRPRAGWAMLAIGVLPPFLGWQGVVLKDAQLVGALLAAVGLVGWWRLRGRRMPPAAVAGVAVLFGYAVLVRANAVFIGVPLAVMLAPWPVRAWARVTIALLGIVGVLAVSPILNHQVMRAESSGVERTQALFDLAGIAVRARGAADVGLTAAETATIVARHCASPFFWDPLGDDAHCADTMARLRALPVGALYATLAGAALHHPIAYAGARLAHLNSTTRWLVPFGWPSAAPPGVSEANTLGLGTPGAAAREGETLVALTVETPLGWPIAWIVVAIGALAVAGGRRQEAAGGMACALLVSALTLEASFAVLSIASDLRYHLWPMIATAIAVVLLADRWPARRTVAVGGAALAIVLLGGVAARVLLPAPPQTYAGMLDWAPG